jgi:FO synthase
MNETITRAAGASHGQETSPEEMEEIILSIGRQPKQRSTTYGDAPVVQQQKSFGASELKEPEYTAVTKYERKKGSEQKKQLYRPGFDVSDRKGHNDETNISSMDII